MIRETIVRPTPQNKRAYHIFFSLLLGVVAVLAVSVSVSRYKGLIQMLGILLIVPAILVYTRYIGAHYSYEITFDAAGIPVFVVRQQIGKRLSTLCRVNLCDLREATRETAAEAKAHKTPIGFAKYVYTPSIRPALSYRLILRGRHENAEIRIEATPEFIDYLLASAEEARSMFSESED